MGRSGLESDVRCFSFKTTEKTQFCIQKGEENTLRVTIFLVRTFELSKVLKRLKIILTGCAHI